MTKAKSKKVSQKVSEKTKDEIINKMKKTKKVENDSSAKIPKSVAQKETVIETQDDSTALIQKIVPIVVNHIKDDMTLAINTKFEDMKNIVMNELKDIRAKLPQDEVASGKIEHVAHIQDNQVRGLVPVPKPQEQQQQKSGFDISQLVQLIPLLKESGILGGSEKPVESTGDLIQQMVMKKFVADIGRSDNQNEMVTNYLLKKMIQSDPKILDGIGKPEKVGNGGNENIL